MKRLLLSLAVLLVLLPVAAACQPTTAPPTIPAPGVTAKEVRLQDISVTPPHVEPGKTVNIAATVYNPDNVERTVTVTLHVDGILIETKEVKVALLSTTTVTFSSSNDVPGNHTVEVNGLSSSFVVVKPPARSPDQAQVTVVANQAVSDFPNRISFAFDATSQLPTTGVVLEYGTNAKTIASETYSVRIQVSATTAPKATYTWEMKKTGSIPPGAIIWWQWRVTDQAGGTFTTNRETAVWNDTRFQWQVENTPALDLYWHKLGRDSAKILTQGLEERLSRIELGVTLTADRKPKIYIYSTFEEMRSAMLFQQDWTGGLAIPSYNVILLTANTGNLDWAKTTLAHEITHLMVREAVFGPFGSIPTWLNEGLAEYAKGEADPVYTSLLNRAFASKSLLPVASLSGMFPTDSQKASLAYAQSRSLVAYLIGKHGWPKMRELLTVFRDGSTYDNALKKVYAFDVAGLEAKWLEWLGSTI